jgi:hypothetical protein
MNYKAIVIVGLLIIALLSWLVCRNFKDEKDFEKNIDDPANDFKHHKRGDRT